MENTYPITPEQISMLDKFTCVRLSSDPDHRGKIKNFQSDLGENMVTALRGRGWEEDERGTKAYYVVKDKQQGRIMLFFSLRCGALFDPDYEDQCSREFTDTQQLLIAHGRPSDADEDTRRRLDDLRRELGDAAYSQYIAELREHYKEVKRIYQLITRDQRWEPNKKIIRVDQIHSAVELSEFCVNDRFRGVWNEMFRSSFVGRRHTMGQVFFWWFIVPKMLEVSRVAGCEYAYLFAADRDPDGNLVRYYEHALHFRKLTHLGAIKPYFDLDSFFMGCRLLTVDEKKADAEELKQDPDALRGLDHYRQEFFDNFNLRTDANDII